MKTEQQPKKTASKAKKVYNIVSTTLVLLVFAFLIAIVGVVMYQRTHGGEVSLFGYYMYNVISPSMEPTIDVGDVIIAKKVEDANSLKEGDVVTFTAPSGDFAGRNITHRIVEVVQNEDGSVKYFKTKGDNPQANVDNWQLKPYDVKAKFVRVSPFISGFREFISHWYGYVVLVVIPLVFVGVLIIVGYVRDKMEEAKAEQAATVHADDLTDEQKRELLSQYLSGMDASSDPSATDGQPSHTAEDSRSSKQDMQAEDAAIPDDKNDET